MIEEPSLDAHPASSDWHLALAVGGLCLVMALALVAVVAARARRRGQTTARAVLGVVLVALGFLGLPTSLLAAGYGLVWWGFGSLVACTAALWGGARLLRARRPVTSVG